MKNEAIAPWHNFFDPSRFLGGLLTGLVSGAAAGLVAGALARVAMRIVAVLGGMTPGFTIGGTLGIMAAGVLIGMAPGILYAATLPVWTAGAMRKGLTIGIVLAILFSSIFFLIEAEGELALIPIWMISLMFGLIALVYGLVFGFVASRLTPAGAAAPTMDRSVLRSAGTLTLIGGLASGVLLGFMAVAFPAATVVGPAAARLIESLAGYATALALVAGLLGLLQSGAAGRGRFITIGLGATLTFAAVLGMASIFDGGDMVGLHGLVRVIGLVGFNQDMILLLFVLGAAVLFIFSAGIAVLRSGRWQGWRRYSVLAAGLVPLLSIPVLHPALLPALLNLSVFERNRLGHLVGAVYGLAWLAVGIALRIEAENQPETSGEPG